jgi:glycosyltransferase involved in cell wall biosynthesis
MRKFNSQEIKEFVSKPLFDERIILKKDLSYPKISIVTPSYNQAEFLERTILSILNQNYPNLEYIIIDGGSTDGSVEIIKKYEKYLTYWVSEPDKGQADALNKGFKIATGEILTYLNSDDVFLPGILHRIALEFEKKRDIEVLYGNKLLISPKDEIISERRFVKWLPLLSKLGLFSGAGFGVHLDSSFFRKELYNKIKGFDLTLRNAMDTDMFLQMVNLGAKFHFLREYFIGFRLHKESKTITSGKNIGPEESQYLFSKYYPYKFKIPFIGKYLLKMLWAILFILEGDMDYLIKRIFIERRKDYQEYIT